MQLCRINRKKIEQGQACCSAFMVRTSRWQCNLKHPGRQRQPQTNRCLVKGIEGQNHNPGDCNFSLFFYIIGTVRPLFCSASQLKRSTTARTQTVFFAGLPI